MNAINKGPSGRLERGKISPDDTGGPGRPRGSKVRALVLTEALRSYLNGDTIAGMRLPRGLTVAEAIAEAMILHALKGNFRFLKEIFDRVDGPVPKRGLIAHELDEPEHRFRRSENGGPKS